MAEVADGLAAAVKPEDPNGSINFGEVTLTPGQTERLATFLAEEIERATRETQEFRERLNVRRRFLDPGPPQEKPFPWPRASNLRMPIGRIVMDSLCASAKQGVTKQKKRWVAEFEDAEAAGVQMGEQAATIDAVEEFCETVSSDPARLDLRGVVDGWFEEQLVSGFAGLKVVSATQRRRLVLRANTPAVDVVTRRGPQWLVVPTETLVWPSGLWRSVQEMPWIGNWVEMTPSALKERARSHGYRFVTEIIDGQPTGVPDGATQQKLDSVGMVAADNVRLHEIYVKWDLFGDGDLHDVLVTFHLPTRRVSRIVYCPMRDGQYPYEIGTASPRVGMLPGRSILEPCIEPIRAINTAINQAFDSQTLANSPSIKYPEESPTAEAMANGFFPGIPLPYKEDINEVGLLEFPQPSAVTFTMVGFFLNIVERLTRVGPPRLGDVSQAQRTPASLGLSMQQLGAEVIDEFIDRSREILGNLMCRTLRLYYLEDPDIFVKTIGSEKGVLVRSVVERSVTDDRPLAELLRIRLFATSASRNKELEKQNRFAMVQMAFGWYEKAVNVIGMMMQPEIPPQAREVLSAVLKGSQTMLMQIAELLEQPDAQIIVPDLVSLVGAAQPAGPPVTPEAMLMALAQAGGGPAMGLTPAVEPAGQGGGY